MQINWPQVIKNIDRTDADISNMLADRNVNYQPISVTKLRTGETKTPSYYVGVALLDIEKDNQNETFND